VPGVGAVTLSPDLVLLIFLPPLLYGAAFFANPRELRDNVRPIGLLAVGLVIAHHGHGRRRRPRAARAALGRCVRPRRDRLAHPTSSPPRRSSAASGSRAGS